MPGVTKRLPLPALLTAALALLFAVVPLPPATVESVYSSRIYLAFQPWLTAASNAAPFALLDLLIIVGAAWWLVEVFRSARRHAENRWRAVRHMLVLTVVAAGVCYIAFVALWGLNYRRVPLADKLRTDASGMSVEAARRLAADAVAQVNALYAVSRGDVSNGDPDTPDKALFAAFERTQTDLGATRLARPGRPKHSLLDIYFRRAGVDGMTDPYFLETLIAGGLLPFERPFVIAHEWGHLAGYADESEANFVGWLTCLRGSPADQYSGWLFLYNELAGGLPRAGHPGADLAPGPRADLRAIAARIAREVQPRVAEAGWRVYDRYLKANRVEAGTASYANVVRLILTTRFDSEWRPQLKRTSP